MTINKKASTDTAEKTVTETPIKSNQQQNDTNDISVEKSPEANTEQEDLIKKLTKEKEDSNHLANEYKTLLQKNQAEFENFKKRLVKEKEDWFYYCSSKLLKELITVMDNFERALKQKDELDLKTISSDKKKFTRLLQHVEGFDIIYKQLVKFFKDHKVEKIAGVGSVFDPNYHQAIQQEENDDDYAKEDLISEVYEEGYLFDGKILRSATVKVSKKKSS